MRPFHDLDVEKDKKPLTWAYVWKVLGSFVHYYTPLRPLFFLSLFCSIAGAGMQMLIPLCVYRSFQGNNTLSVILFLIAAIFILMCLIAVCNYICTKYGHIVGVRMEANMRDDLFAHLQKLSFNYFDAVEQLFSNLLYLKCECGFVNHLVALTTLSRLSPHLTSKQ